MVVKLLDTTTKLEERGRCGSGEGLDLGGMVPTPAGGLSCSGEDGG
jgi:hypothetical protein